MTDFRKPWTDGLVSPDSLSHLQQNCVIPPIPILLQVQQKVGEAN